MLAGPRGGMATNGGCEHVQRNSAERIALMRAMGAEIARLRAEVEGLRAHTTVPR
jgi:hypothetical protein